MTIYIGSARSDENGNYSGGKPGDQKQTSTNDLKGEVSQQAFYVHKKGWDVLRAKTQVISQGIANAMIRACANACIGYSQSGRLEIIKNGTRTRIPTNCDCSSLVRQCINEASALNVGNFTTATEKDVLMRTGMFDLYPYTPDFVLKTGDILVTKTKGHTAVVTSGEVKSSNSQVAFATTRQTLRVGSKGKDVLYLHKRLKEMGYGVDPNNDYFDSMTKMCVVYYQSTHDLKPDGIVGQKTWAELEKA